MSYFVKQLKRQTVGRTICLDQYGRVTSVNPLGTKETNRSLHFYDFAWQGGARSDKEDARRDRIRDRVSKIQDDEFDEHGELYYCDLDLSSDAGRTAVLEGSHICLLYTSPSPRD